MAGRRLSPAEQALWDAVVGTARPIRPVARRAEPVLVAASPKPETRLITAPIRMPPAPVRAPVATLDSSWERKIRGGTLSPEFSIDLHGHTLSGAHARLNQAIAMAVAQGVRILLVVTGKPRKNEAGPGGNRRGAIRAEIGHWLGSGPWADRIASVRTAHPRHGGDGAIYIILRREK